MMYLIIVMGIYHILKMILKKEKSDETLSTSHALNEDSRHPAEIQLR